MGRDEDRGIGRIGSRTAFIISGHSRSTGHHTDHRRTPDTCGLKGIRIGEAKNPGPGSESQSSTSVLEQGEITSGQRSTMKGEDPNNKRKKGGKRTHPNEKGENSGE